MTTTDRHPAITALLGALLTARRHIPDGELRSGCIVSDGATLRERLRVAGTALLGQAEIPASYAVLDEIAAERDRQDARWGEQNHPDGTGPDTGWVDQITPAFGWDDQQAAHAAKLARRSCQQAARVGHVTWLHILREEVAEAFAESDPAKLRAELVQVAAVAVAQIEAIDRRTEATR